MENVHRLHGRRRREAEMHLQAVLDFADRAGIEGDAAHRLRQVVEEERQALREWRFVQVNPSRRREVDAALFEVARSPRDASDALNRCLEALPWDSQELPHSAAEFRRQWEWSEVRSSRAFRALVEVGALIPVRKAGKSVVYAVDANLATRQLPAARERSAEAQASARAAPAAPVKLREVPL